MENKKDLLWHFIFPFIYNAKSATEKNLNVSLCHWSTAQLLRGNPELIHNDISHKIHWNHYKCPLYYTSANPKNSLSAKNPQNTICLILLICKLQLCNFKSAVYGVKRQQFLSFFDILNVWHLNLQLTMESSTVKSYAWPSEWKGFETVLSFLTVI